jgi:predicted AlkP superfamily pyrophosphatase or phosphodiesterase
MSDHGHSVIENAIHPEVFLPDIVMQSEGSVLLVAPRDAEELNRVTAALTEYGCDPFHVDYVPENHRTELAAFVAPDGWAFEYDPEATEAQSEPTGKPKMPSSHGLRPGKPGDDRFAVFAGPDVAPGVVESANAVQVSPTFATLLGLSTDVYPAAPIFDLQRA